MLKIIKDIEIAKGAKCKICGNKAEFIYNIGFKPTPICERCANAITIQNIHHLMNIKFSFKE